MDQIIGEPIADMILPAPAERTFTFTPTAIPITVTDHSGRVIAHMPTGETRTFTPKKPWWLFGFGKLRWTSRRTPTA